MSRTCSTMSSNTPLDAPPNYAESSSSAPGPSAGSSQTTFACISLNLTDRIRLIRFPSKHVGRIEEVVRRAWPKGIQATRVYGVSHEIKTKGNPWSGTTWDREKLESRSLMSNILEELYNMGWLLKASVDISKKERDKGML
jgi:hypothetical protein